MRLRGGCCTLGLDLASHVSYTLFFLCLLRDIAMGGLESRVGDYEIYVC
jgi:hypothetical protein